MLISMAMVFFNCEGGGDDGIADSVKRYNERSVNMEPSLNEYCQLTGDPEDCILVEHHREKYKEYLMTIGQNIPTDSMIGREMALLDYKSITKRIKADIIRVYKGIKWLDGF
jgi:hypothetical protein